MQRLAIYFTFLVLVSGNLAQAEGNVFTPQRFGSSFVPKFSGIFAGDPVKKSDFGWSSTVAIKLNGGSCSGTLISPIFVITAGHCGVHQPQRVGFYDGEKIVDVRNVVKTTVHPNYNADAVGDDWSNYNDIALIQLESPAPSQYTPVGIISSVSQLQSNVLLQGFGRIGPSGAQNGLTSTTLKISAIDAKGFLLKLTDPSLKQSACPGDSGGPAYVKNGSSYYLAAVTSFIDAKDGNCADPLHSTFSVLIVNYVEWIKSVTNAARQQNQQNQQPDQNQNKQGV
jgi:secreted trypsin-like serine protease